MELSSKISKAVNEPWKLKRYLGVVLRSLPYRFRLTKLVPRSYHFSHAPDRYVTHLKTYKSRTAHQFYEPRDSSFWTAGNAGNAGDMTRFYFLHLACDQIVKEGLTGDVAELGVYKGNSATLLARLARALRSTVYLFDTFEGFDDRDFAGRDAKVGASAADAAFADTSLDSVRRLVGENNVRYVKGYFPDSLAQVDDSPRFCLVHIDCDLYAPFRAALEYFYPRLTEGGWLIMHDYSSFVWEGVEAVVDEFFADKPERPILIPDKSGTAVIRKAHRVNP